MPGRLRPRRRLRGRPRARSPSSSRARRRPTAPSAALPAGAAAPRPRDGRLPEVVPAPRRQRSSPSRATRREAAEQYERASRHEDWSEFQSMTDLVLMPAACYPVYPAIAARGPLPAGRRRRRRRRRLRLPPRAVRRPGAHADVPPARDRPHRRARGRRRPGATRWRDRARRAAARARPRRRSSTSPPTRSSAAAGGCSPPASASRSSSSRSSCRSPAPSRPRSPRSTTTRTTSPSAFGIELADGSARAHRLPRLRPGADRARAASHATASTSTRGRRRCAASCGPT